jgi:hypothetical protein
MAKELVLPAAKQLVWPKLTMDVTTSWIEQHCVVPDGDLDLDGCAPAFEMRDFQLCFVGNHYSVRPQAGAALKGTAFQFRMSMLMDVQKKGKSPLAAAMICVEAVGPALFAGFAAGGERWKCSEQNCGCGWVYEYEPGEPMARRWRSPLIQITATSEDQTGNTYDALRPMIDLGPLADQIPKTGEEVIRLPGGKQCQIVPVTAKAMSRLGQRVTFVLWDELGIYADPRMWHVYRTQARGLTLMGGRGVAMTNPDDPAEDNVAKDLIENRDKSVYIQYIEPPADLRFDKKSDRTKILKFNYADAPWALMNLETVEADLQTAMRRDPAEAERFYGNRRVIGSGHWLREEDWVRKQEPREVPDGTAIVLGVDLSNNNDFTGIRAQTADGYQFTPTYGDEQRPTIWRPQDFSGRIPRGEVRAAIDELARRYVIVRGYVDPAGSAKGASVEDDAVEDDSWRLELKEWQAKYQRENPKTGKPAPVFFIWETYVLNKMHAALETFRASVNLPEAIFRTDKCPTTQIHIRNAIVRNRTGQRYLLGKPSEHQKIDMTMSSVLCHEAAADASLAEEFSVQEDEYAYIF